MKKIIMKMTALMLMLLFTATTFSQVGQFVDQRDGKTYQTTTIDGKIVMAQNLNYSATGNCYGNLESNCILYGRLYTWQQAMNGSTTEGAQGICPQGWHVPSKAEVESIFMYLGGQEVSGYKLKKIAV